MWGNLPAKGRFLLVALAVFWTVGAFLLLASWRSAAAENRARQAPTCSESQLFTSAECQITLHGTMAGLTHDQAKMDVSGRHISANVTLAGQLPDVAGVPVRVTFYRGEPIHIEVLDLKIDTNRAPSSSRETFQIIGMFFLIGGTVLVGANVLLGFIGRLGSR
ncbi:hypothetical protein OG799_17530 [Micromonospora sp. NBC_00898]|uniref:hypothetical protein n=1 Tax=Micromonospora sp. NBC_00898 TaxID=2975981 RepID=UPI00386A0F79|nr:hypothetical protein OG799_17530 [Micromonospora sp. NBC_00898]